MSGEQIHVRHDEGVPFLPGSPADAASLCNPGAGNRSLERSQDQFFAIHTVKTGPPETHLLMKQCRQIGHVGDRIVLTGQQSLHLRQ